MAAGDTYGDVYKTSDYGQHWTELTIPITTVYNYNVAISANGQVILAANDGGSGPALVESFDGGQTWVADTNITSPSGVWALAGSADLSRVVVFDNSSVLQTGFDPALVTVPSTPSGSKPAPAAKTNSLTSPDTGYGLPQDYVTPVAFVIVGTVSLGFGLALFCRREIPYHG